MPAAAEAYLRTERGNSRLLINPDRGRGGRVDGRMNGGQEKECGLCGGRERQTTGAGQGVAGGVGTGMCSLDDKVGDHAVGRMHYCMFKSMHAHTYSTTQSCGLMKSYCTSKGRK